MKKLSKVVMLPTEKATKIILDKGNLEYIQNEQIASTINSSVKGFHLYFTNDEEIKEGDWFLDDQRVHTSDNNGKPDYMVSKCIEIKNGWIISKEGVGCNPGWSKKIVASTDESLVIDTFINQGDSVQGDIVIRRNSNIPTRLKGKISLPRPSNEFLKKYCELGGIDKVLIDYKINNTLGADPVYFPDEPQHILKIAPDNTISIYTIKHLEMD